MSETEEKKETAEKPVKKIETAEDKLCKLMLDKRGIRESSCRTYISALKKVYAATGADGKIENWKWLKDYSKVMEAIEKQEKLTSKKNKLTAVLVALSVQKKKDTQLIDRYQKKLAKWNDQYMDELERQKKTKTQRDNWLSYKELVKTSNELMEKVKEFKTEKKLTRKEFDILQQLVVIRTYLEFPLRNDFADMPVIKKIDYNKLSDDQKKHNYLLIGADGKKAFILTQYKNSKFLGEKRFDVPKPLNSIINLWLKHNTSGWFLVQIRTPTKAMNPNLLTKYLNKIFKKYNKKISSSMIRHIVISHQMKDEPTIKEKQQKEIETQDMFLHSGKVHDLYRKID
jgi:hypothetical protein